MSSGPPLIDYVFGRSGQMVSGKEQKEGRIGQNRIGYGRKGPNSTRRKGT